MPTQKCFVFCDVCKKQNWNPSEYVMANFQFLVLSVLLWDYAGRGIKGRLNNLMIQLRKNCNHPDLLEAAFEGSCMCHFMPVFKYVCFLGNFKAEIHFLYRFLSTFRTDSWTMWEISVAGKIAGKAVCSQAQSMPPLLWFVLLRVSILTFRHWDVKHFPS